MNSGVCFLLLVRHETADTTHHLEELIGMSIPRRSTLTYPCRSPLLWFRTADAPRRLPTGRLPA